MKRDLIIAAIAVFALAGAVTKVILRDVQPVPVYDTTGTDHLNSYSESAGAASAAAGDQQVLDAQAQHLRRVEVTLEGPVFKMLRDDTKGLPHERWLMKLSNGTTVLIAHDTKLAPRLPLSNGDVVKIHGEYIWNEKGGVIHWTHHDPQGRHEPGWIDFKGQRYQ